MHWADVAHYALAVDDGDALIGVFEDLLEDVERERHHGDEVEQS